MTVVSFTEEILDLFFSRVWFHYLETGIEVDYVHKKVDNSKQCASFLS